METHRSDTERRSAPRIRTQIDPPVYINHLSNGTEMGMLVEDLSTGGAMLICPEMGNVDNGYDFGDCTLVFQNTERVAVNPIVRWALWPRVGVQFNGLSDQSRQRISTFLNSITQPAPEHSNAR